MMNKKIIKSVYLEYLHNAGHGILNSIQVSNDTSQNNSESIKAVRSLFPLYKTASKVEIRESEFKYKIKGTSIEQTLRLKRL